jgi:hypothetical protein
MGVEIPCQIANLARLGPAIAELPRGAIADVTGTYIELVLQLCRRAVHRLTLSEVGAGRCSDGCARLVNRRQVQVVDDIDATAARGPILDGIGSAIVALGALVGLELGHLGVDAHCRVVLVVAPRLAFVDLVCWIGWRWRADRFPLSAGNDVLRYLPAAARLLESMSGGEAFVGRPHARARILDW